MRTRHIALAGAFAATLGLAGTAFAQSTTPGATAPNLGPTGQPMTQQAPRQGTQAPGTEAQRTNPTPMPPGSQANQAPGMGATTSPASPPPGTTAQGAPGAAPATGATTRAAPVQGGGEASQLQQGANSFTEGQARSRITDAGFADVQGLSLDDQGIWRGRAMRNGQQTGVGLDYQGNIAATP
ncbi:hypothetical protein ACVFYP_12175 [Roseomonas sp. F4]